MAVRLDYADTDYGYHGPGFWMGCLISALVGFVLWDLIALVFAVIG